MEYRIYLDGKLIDVNYSNYALMCNFTMYQEKYGEDRVTFVRTKITMDDEKREYLESHHNTIGGNL